MNRKVVFFVLTIMAGCSQAPRPDVPMPTSPMRVASLDLCADQYVLRFVEKERIAAVSPDAVKDFSFMRDEAKTVPVVRPMTEDILVLKPDLVVRSYGGGPKAEEFFARAGIPVLNIGWANDFGAIAENTQRIATALGAEDEGVRVAEHMLSRLEEIGQTKGADILYMTPGGVTTGPGSLLHEAIEAAGFTNFQTRAGWNAIPLERLAYEQPDFIAASFFEEFDTQPAHWSAMRHPIAQRQLRDKPMITLDGAWTACGGWYTIHAVEALTAGGRG